MRRRSRENMLFRAAGSIRADRQTGGQTLPDFHYVMKIRGKRMTGAMHSASERGCRVGRTMWSSP